MTKISTSELPIREPLPGELELSPDALAVVQRELREQIFGFGHIGNLLKDGKSVSRDLLYNVLYMAECRVAQLCKITGIELDSVAERDQRYARIRDLNEQVQELHRELGRGGTVEQTKAHLKNASDILNKWWDAHGLGHISDMHISPYGHLEAKFSCHLFGEFSHTGSQTPVSDEEAKKLWHKSLRDRGFKLIELAHEREPSLEDCDQNRATLTALFKTSLPSCELLESKNHFNRQGRVMLLRDVRVIIYDLQDIFNLPEASSAVASA